MDSTDAFHVERWMDTLGGIVTGHRRWMIRLGNLETRLLADELNGFAVDRPIYVSGLARSGSTILLEVLSRHGDTATHQYRDYPPLFTPLLWNRFLDRTPRRDAEAVERSHGDGIMVTPESPEALEEILWMAFFPHLHDPSQRNVLDGDTSNPAFERFYGDHIRKLLLLRGGSRYLAKANYNATRFEYLLKLFPDARLVLPVRSPAGHIASLMKQHALLSEGERRNPGALRYMRRVGHYEFGLDRRPVAVGHQAEIGEIVAAWEDGAEVEGWALYWRHIHRYLADRLAANPALAEATLVVRFEDLCDSPRKTLEALFTHCDLPAAEELIEQAARTIRFPTYYKPSLNPADLEVIDRETRATAQRFGYSSHLG